MSSNNPQIVFKIVVIGDTGVGKTCLVHRYAEDKFLDNHTPTVGVDFRPVYRDFKGQTTKLMIWDTAGHERFKSITTSFYHGAHGAIIVYDVTNRRTLFSIMQWMSELKRICGDIPVIIVGNKWDCSKTRITTNEIETYIEEMGFSDKHFLSSAVTSENIKEAFQALLKLLMANKKISYIPEEKLKLRKEETSRGCSC